MVDVRGLHQADFLLDGRIRDRVAHPGVRLVAVDAFELDLLAVDPEALLGLPLARGHLHLAEAQLRRHRLNQHPAVIAQRQEQRVEIRALGRPEFGAVETQLKPRAPKLLPGQIHRLLGNAIPRIINRLNGRDLVPLAIHHLGRENSHRRALRSVEVLELHIHRQLPAPIHLLPLERLGGGEEVANVQLGHGVELNRAEEARQARHILALEVGRVAMTVDLGRQDVVARLEEGRDAEGRRIARILREAHILAVDPQVEEGVHTVKLKVNLLAGPLSGHREVAPIGAHRVARLVVGVVLGRGGHHPRPIARKGIGLVGVKRRPPPLLALRVRAHRLPRRGHHNRLPIRDIIRRILEAHRPRRRVLAPLELPRRGAIQTQPTRTKTRQNLLGRLLVGEAKGPRARGFLIIGEVLLLLPLQTRRRGCRPKSVHGQRRCRQTADAANR